MASATECRFRFLDLPAKLRCCVYEQIEFPTLWHVLDRIDSQLDKRDWPVPPKKQVSESRITLIRPHAERAIQILLTCHLINDEARSILKRRVKHIKAQPVRYLVNYPAAWALIDSGSPLRPCLGSAPEFPLVGDESVWLTTFVDTCVDALSQTRRRPDGTRGPRTIEMTIYHKTGVVYGREIVEVTAFIADVRETYYCPTRLVVVYKSPLPSIRFEGGTKTSSGKNMEDFWLQNIPRDLGPKDMATGVFVRLLEEEAFEKHLEGLEVY
jgi:hypothetical protein